MTWIKGTGRIEIDNGIRIITNVDICKYYSWFIKKEFWNTIKTQIPKHQGHISIILPKIYGISDFSKALKYKNRKVEFAYDPENMYISKVNFWLPAQCYIEKEIKDLFGIKDDPDKYWGLHLVVANKKFNG